MTTLDEMAELERELELPATDRTEVDEEAYSASLETLRSDVEKKQAGEMERAQKSDTIENLTLDIQEYERQARRVGISQHGFYKALEETICRPMEKKVRRIRWLVRDRGVSNSGYRRSSRRYEKMMLMGVMGAPILDFYPAMTIPYIVLTVGGIAGSFLIPELLDAKARTAGDTANAVKAGTRAYDARAIAEACVHADYTISFDDVLQAAGDARKKELKAEDSERYAALEGRLSSAEKRTGRGTLKDIVPAEIYQDSKRMAELEKIYRTEFKRAIDDTGRLPTSRYVREVDTAMQTLFRSENAVKNAAEAERTARAREERQEAYREIGKEVVQMV